MAQIDSDINFSFLLMVLAIVLVTLLAGAKINEIVIHRNGLITEALWQFAFIILLMLVIVFAILKPYLSYELGHFSVIVSGIKLGIMFWFYSYHPTSFFVLGQATVFAELISTLLIIASGVLLLKASKTETLADKLKK
jgi:hypothetical protein